METSRGIGVFLSQQQFYGLETKHREAPTSAIGPRSYPAPTLSARPLTRHPREFGAGRLSGPQHQPRGPQATLNVRSRGPSCGPQHQAGAVGEPHAQYRQSWRKGRRRRTGVFQSQDGPPPGCSRIHGAFWPT